MDSFLHDFAYQWGGAEQVLQALAEPFPAAPITVVGGSSAALKQQFSGRSVTRIAPWLLSNRSARVAVPLLAQRLPRMRPLTGRITCSSYAVSRWVPTERPRLVYCHSPIRQIWHGYDAYASERSVQGLGLRIFGEYVRRVDLASTNERDVVVVPSARIGRLYAQIYGTEANHIIPPPVVDAFFAFPIGKPQDYFIWVGRIVEPVKRLSWLMRTFRERPDLRLLVVGAGRNSAALQAEQLPNVEFTGWLDPRSVMHLVSEAQALLLPSMEDFGIAGAEALALGIPVIASSEAGVSDVISHGSTGLVSAPSQASFASAVHHFDRHELADPQSIRESVERLTSKRFREALLRPYGDLEWLP